jgi:hypothetical protein
MNAQQATLARECLEGAKSLPTLTPPLKPPSALNSLQQVDLAGVIFRVQQ